MPDGHADRAADQNRAAAERGVSQKAITVQSVIQPSM